MTIDQHGRLPRRYTTWPKGCGHLTNRTDMFVEHPIPDIDECLWGIGFIQPQEHE